MTSGALPSTADLLLALFATWLVEWAGFMIALRRPPRPRDGLSFLAINAVTNPLAHAARDLLGVSFLGVEAAVVLVEVPLLRLLLLARWRSAALASLLLNGTTMLLSDSAVFAWA